MKKEEYIARRGEVAYAKKLARSRAWIKTHPEGRAAINKAYRESYPEEVAAAQKVKNREHSNKGGKHYEKKLVYKRTGIQGGKNIVRNKHGTLWREYKNIIALESQIHHEWIPGTADYCGVALVEANQHMHGFVDVIEILEGNITLLTEAEIGARGVIT